MLGNPDSTQPAEPPPLPQARNPGAGFKILFAEVNGLAIRLKECKLSAGGVTILQILAQQGPQTVPQIARIRFTSRQNIQVLVNGLQREGCVELSSNPAHKRSGLVGITGKGREWLARETEREGHFLERLTPRFSEAAVLAAAGLLREVRQMLSPGDGPPAEARSERRVPRRSPKSPVPVTPETSQSEETELPVNLL
jgi:DNA-binding MarR family transcriptional regulator